MKGPWLIKDLKSEMRPSDFEGRPDYEVGLQLTVEGPTGKLYVAGISRKDVLYHRFSAWLNEHPDTQQVNITWDEQRERVLISGSAAPASS